MLKRPLLGITLAAAAAALSSLATLDAQLRDDPGVWCEGELVLSDSALAPDEDWTMVFGRLGGRVLDAATGDGVGAATVTLPSAGIEAVTDGDGSFELSDVPPGPRGIEVRHASYDPQRSCLAIPPARSVILLITLDPEPIPLEPMTVQVEAVRPRWLEGTGFYHRMSAADGIFITREEIIDENPSRLTELFRGRLGVTVTAGRLVPRHAPTTLLTRDCRIQYFVNGRRMPLPLGLDTFHPADVEAIEAYFGSPRLPAQFNVGRAACGAVVIWLRIR